MHPWWLCITLSLYRAITELVPLFITIFFNRNIFIVLIILCLLKMRAISKKRPQTKAANNNVSVIINESNPHDQIYPNTQTTHLTYLFLRLAINNFEYNYGVRSDSIDAINQTNRISNSVTIKCNIKSYKLFSYLNGVISYKINIIIFYWSHQQH